MNDAVGILALQGDFAEHAAALSPYGIRCSQIRRVGDLLGLRGLVLPGGESTTMLKLIDIQGLRPALEQILGSGLPVLATCAGLILLAREVVGPRQESFGCLDLKVRRNGYGRQICSGTFALSGDLPTGTTGVFIRAPRILECGPSVEILARRGDDPVLVRTGNLLAACFHPELQERHPVIELFVRMLDESQASGQPGQHPAQVSSPLRQNGCSMDKL